MATTIWSGLDAGIVRYDLTYDASRPDPYGDTVNITFHLHTYLRNSTSYFGYQIKWNAMWCNGTNWYSGLIKDNSPNKFDFWTDCSISVSTANNYVPGVRLIMTSPNNTPGSGNYDTGTDINISVPAKSTPAYWNNVNVLNPAGEEDYKSGTFYLYTSENNSSRGPMTDQDADMTHTRGTYFDVYNIVPYYGYYELDHVSGYDSIPSSGRYRKTFVEGGVMNIYMRYKSYYRDINAYQPDGSTQNGLMFDYTIKNRSGTVVNTYTNVTNEVSGSVTREYGYTGTISNIRPNITGAHYTTNNITGTSASSFSWTFDNENAIHLYSAWNTYTVKYNGNGNTGGSTASSNHTYNTAKTLTANGFTKTGYSFAGWATSSTATTATYSDGQSVSNLTSTNGGTVNLYAVWTKNSYYLDLNGWLDGASSGTLSPYRTVNLTVDGSTVGTNISDYYSQHPYGASYSVSNIQAKQGYRYNGVHSGSLSGTIGDSTNEIVLDFSTIAPSNLNLNPSIMEEELLLFWSADGNNITNYKLYIDNVQVYSGTDTGYSIIAIPGETYEVYFTATNAGGITTSQIWTINIPAKEAKVWIKDNNAWKVGKVYIKIDGNWIEAKRIYRKIGGIWIEGKHIS